MRSRRGCSSARMPRRPRRPSFRASKCGGRPAAASRSLQTRPVRWGFGRGTPAALRGGPFRHCPACRCRRCSRRASPSSHRTAHMCALLSSTAATALSAPLQPSAVCIDRCGVRRSLFNAAGRCAPACTPTPRSPLRCRVRAARLRFATGGGAGGRGQNPRHRGRASRGCTRNSRRCGLALLAHVIDLR